MSNTGTPEQHKHPKQDFQVERLAFFSDAVFAIALTLLIIEIKVPHVDAKTSTEDLLGQLQEIKPQILALLVSFWLISIYWMRHHFLFKHVHNYNRQVVAANLVFLLPIIFFPFTTAFLAESTVNNAAEFIAMQLFLLNHIIAGIALYVLYWMVTVWHKEFSFDMDAAEKKYFITNSLTQTLIFIFLLIATLIIKDKEMLYRAAIAGVIAKIVLERIFKARGIKNKRPA
jgi:uncharacterized membrane protein